ncbi:CvpA family protein [Salinicoccus sp. YB14-2]|uniref:CvpA family protein n=1 Tax=Salinicoccus sp. YB14-2 TaxID=1572701 RepID=UPI0006914B16|nr:CvpA family protein [Salinicoccus sp. YB14-2]
MTLIILILLIIGIIVGYRRGFILQFFHLIGTIAAVIIAALNFEHLASRLDLVLPYPSTTETLANPIFPDIVNAEYAYYDMSAFFVIFIVTKIVIQLIVSAFDYFQQIPVFGIVGEIVGAVLGLFEIIYVLVVILFMLSMVPLEFIQTSIQDSGLANFILEHTFILSDKFMEWLQIES